MSCGRPHATSCTQVIASLSSYIDGEVSAEEYQLIAIHMSECPPCEREEQVVRRVQALVVRATSQAAAPETLRARIRATIVEYNANPSRDTRRE